MLLAGLNRTKYNILRCIGYRSYRIATDIEVNREAVKPQSSDSASSGTKDPVNSATIPNMTRSRSDRMKRKCFFCNRRVRNSEFNRHTWRHSAQDLSRNEVCEKSYYDSQRSKTCQTFEWKCCSCCQPFTNVEDLDAHISKGCVQYQSE